MKEKLAPIVLFVYNRPNHTQKTVEALQKNDLATDSDLYIFSDEAKDINSKKKVEEVRAYIDSINGFKKVTVIKRNKNFGLANSIIDGVTSVIEKYEKVIVLEDDLITSPYFLQYMNQGLELLKDKDNIWSITGFSFSREFMNFPKSYNEDIYLNIRPMSWSWATWKNRWSRVDWKIEDYQLFILNNQRIKDFEQGGTDLTNMLNLQMNGQIDSWYIRWAYNACKFKMYTVYPSISYVNNFGHDGTGVHCACNQSSIYSHDEINKNKKIQWNTDIKLNYKIVKNFNKAFNLKFRSRLKILLKRFLKI